MVTVAAVKSKLDQGALALEISHQGCKAATMGLVMSLAKPRGQQTGDQYEGDQVPAFNDPGFLLCHLVYAGRRVKEIFAFNDT